MIKLNACESLREELSHAPNRMPKSALIAELSALKVGQLYRINNLNKVEKSFSETLSKIGTHLPPLTSNPPKCHVMQIIIVIIVGESRVAAA